MLTNPDAFACVGSDDSELFSGFIHDGRVVGISDNGCVEVDADGFD